MFDTLRNYINGRATQRDAIPGTVANSAGGYSYAVDNWQRFERFLILGTTGGTYYIKERKLTQENLDAVVDCLEQDGPRAVELIRNVSIAGKAPKNDPAIFALALACSANNEITRQQAFAAVPDVCRTFTHLSHFIAFIKEGKMRGFGRGLMRAIARWYNEQSVDNLAYQAIKYQSRDGFSQQDVYRLSHPVRFIKMDADGPRRALYDFIAKGTLSADWADRGDEFKPLRRLAAARSLAQLDNPVADDPPKNLQGTKKSLDAANLIREWNLPMEVVPTTLRDKDTYEAVLPSAGLTWILRNLGNLTLHEVLDVENNLDFVVNRLTNAQQLQKARVHPLAILQAMRTYASGKGVKGSNTWKPNRRIVDALDAAFYASFKYVQPTGKRLLFAVDVSGSMTNATASGMTDIAVFEAAAVLAMAASLVEKNFELIAFDYSHGSSKGVYNLPDVSAKQRLDDVVKRFKSFGGGGTDCALPFQYALDNKLHLDAFVCFTDSETWAGNQHAINALKSYRRHMKLPETKAINVAMVANGFSTLPPNDPNTLECVGFDTTIPSVISLFVSG